MSASNEKSPVVGIKDFWCSRNRREIALVCHTSIANYNSDIIKELEKLSVTWIFPNDVQWELWALQKAVDENLSKNAEYLLKKANSLNSPCFDLKDMYEFEGKCRVRPEDIFDGEIIVLFRDAAEAQLFVEKVPAYDNLYVMNTHPRAYVLWENPTSMAELKRIDFNKNPIRRINKHIRKEVSKPKPAVKNPSDLSRIYAYPDNEELSFLKGTSFYPVSDKAGGQAFMFKSARFGEDKLIKYYSKKTVAGAEKYKLKYLQYLGVNHPIKNLMALPEVILLDDAANYMDSTVVGFTMQDFSGDKVKTLKQFICSCHSGANKNKVIQNLLALILELQLNQIYITDPAPENVLVNTETYEVYLIDCDSFEACNIPSSTYRIGYLHPELEPMEQELSGILRKSYHHNFALAFLLFFCVTQWSSPLLQKLSDAEFELIAGGRRWSDFRFVYDYNCEKNEEKHNDEHYAIWNSLPPQMQRCFADEFHFRKYHSLGEWIHMFYDVEK